MKRDGTVLFVPSVQMKMVAMKLKESLDETLQHLKDQPGRLPSRTAEDVTSTLLDSQEIMLAINPWRERVRWTVQNIQTQLEVDIAMFETGT